MVMGPQKQARYLAWKLKNLILVHIGAKEGQVEMFMRSENAVKFLLWFLRAPKYPFTVKCHENYALLLNRAQSENGNVTNRWARSVLTLNLEDVAVCV